MPRPLSFKEIEAFRAVMQTGTTTAAAQLLHTTQPSISRLLAQMQTGADLKLFDMYKGRLRPTAEARELFSTVQQHFVGLDRIERDLQGLRQFGAGTLRIGCTPALGLSIVPAALHNFLQHYPSTHISLQTLGTTHLREGLLHGQFDLVVSTMAIGSPELNASVLHQTQAVCVMHPGHPLAQHSSLHVQDLENQLLLTLNSDDNIYLQLHRTMLEHDVRPSSTVETTYSSTICCLAAQGTGLGVVNPYVAATFASTLCIKPFLPECSVEVALALPSHSAPSERTQCFVGELQKQLAT